MKYPNHIIELYKKIENLMNIGFEEKATTNETEYLAQLEAQINILEGKLEDEAYIYEMETSGDINWRREDDLYDQVHN